MSLTPESVRGNDTLSGDARRELGPIRTRGGKPRTGFTLVEMLVVIAIILVLAAMIFPVFEVVLAKAQSTSCLSNMRNLGMGMRLYSDDYDDRIVPAMLPHPMVAGICWDITIQPYIRNEKLVLCPGDEHPRQVHGALCLPHGYGMNLDLAQVGGYMGSSLTMGMIEDPTRTILLCELNGERFATHGVRRAPGWQERVAIYRHGGGANYTFADGHTRWLKPEATMDPDCLWSPQR